MGKRGGLNKFVPTDEQRRLVATLGGFGIPQTEICKVIVNSLTGKGITVPTLEKHFAEELVSGRTDANSKVAEFLFQKATGQKGEDHSAVTAAIFWLKCRARWKPEREAPAEELGKKEVAARDATTAGVGTDWGSDLVPENVVPIKRP